MHAAKFHFALTSAIVALATSADLSHAQLEDNKPPELQAAEIRIEEHMVKMNTLAEALSRNLGQLHYLRTLCFGDNDQLWRNYAGRMMSMETKGDMDRRRTLVKAFNNGYYFEKDRFEECSEAVSIDAAAISENARQISLMLGDPFREREESAAEVSNADISEISTE